ncbi:MAG: Fur family transcriptional regulator [Planctomycetota bacterium]
MKHSEVVARFEAFLKEENLKLTPQRRRILDRVFATHEHFTADTLYGWLLEEAGPRVSRATVYRTLDVLNRGGFVEGLETGNGGIVYEHVLGQKHHDHLICLGCGRIEEFRNDAIEELQHKVAESKGYSLHRHLLRLSGYCPECREKQSAAPASAPA